MSFSYKAAITIDYTKVSTSAHTDFAVLLFGTYNGTAGAPDLRTVANGGKVQNANGYDIYFYSDLALTTRIPAERVNYNATTGEIEFYVKNANVSNIANTIFYMAYGDAAIATDPNVDGTYGKTSTWNFGFKMVQHLPNGTTLSATDSTSNANNGTLVNTPTPTAGKVDGGALFASGSDQSINFGSSSSLNPAAMTVSMWVKATSLPNAYNTAISRIYLSGTAVYYQLFVKSNGKLAVYLGATGNVSYDGTGSNTLSTGTWYHIAFTYSSSTGLVGYVNGSSDATVSPNGPLASGTWGCIIGDDNRTPNRNWNGVIDEVRISDSVRSSGWIMTEYNNQNSPSTFYTMGNETLIVGLQIRSFGFIIG